MPRSEAWKTFEIGDRVVLTHLEDNAYVPNNWKGYTATIRRLDSFDVYITWDHDPKCAMTPSPWRWELHIEALDPAKIVTTRSGGPVNHVEEYENGLMGILTIDGRELTFHYGKDGHFMPGHDNPIDLVEDK